MFRNLIPMLADKYHVVAPDFPGYGESSAPSVNDFDYSFEGLAIVTEKFTEKLNLSSYSLFLSDIGASIGFRLAVTHPERVTAMIVQNGGAHVEAINKGDRPGLSGPTGEQGNPTFNPLQRKKGSGCLCRLAGVFP
jgi:pimeloyl-ACP methyl ester carboxylesterase